MFIQVIYQTFTWSVANQFRKINKIMKSIPKNFLFYCLIYVIITVLNYIYDLIFGSQFPILSWQLIIGYLVLMLLFALTCTYFVEKSNSK